MAIKNDNSFNFEKSLAELEEVVNTMEQGSLSLEESLKYFERGVSLTKQCQNALKSAEQKVQVLVGEGKEANLQPYRHRTEQDQEADVVEE